MGAQAIFCIFGGVATEAVIPPSMYNVTRDFTRRVRIPCWSKALIWVEKRSMLTSGMKKYLSYAVQKTECCIGIYSKLLMTPDEDVDTLLENLGWARFWE